MLYLFIVKPLDLDLIEFELPEGKHKRIKISAHPSRSIDRQPINKHTPLCNDTIIISLLQQLRVVGRCDCRDEERHAQVEGGVEGGCDFGGLQAGESRVRGLQDQVPVEQQQGVEDAEDEDLDSQQLQAGLGQPPEQGVGPPVDLPLIYHIKCAAHKNTSLARLPW